jgi:parvulin-like peptidyl-prolyl isomerase
VQNSKMAEAVVRTGVALLLGCALTLAGCSKGGEKGGDKGGPPADAKPVTGQPGDEVAKVDNEVITLADINQLVQAWQSGRVQGVDPKTPLAELQKHAVDQIISQKLLYKAAVAAKMVPSDAEIKTTLDQMKASQGMDDAQMAEVLKQQGMTVEEFTKNFTVDQAIRRFVKTAVQDTLKVTPEQAKAFFESHPDQFQHPEQIHARHILFKVDPTATPEQEKAAQQKATDASAKLRKGADFAQMAKDISEDRNTAAGGGDLGFLHRGMLGQAFDSVAFAMTPGQTSAPIRSPFGYQVVRVEDRMAPGTYAYEDVQAQLVKMLYNQRTRDCVNALVDGMRAKAKIKRKI